MHSIQEAAIYPEAEVEGPNDVDCAADLSAKLGGETDVNHAEDPAEESGSHNLRLDPLPMSSADLIKMSSREQRKGHSLAWHSSNGVNGDELTSRSDRASIARLKAGNLRGQRRLNLLSMARSAMMFQDHFSNDEEEKQGVSPLYRVGTHAGNGSNDNSKSKNTHHARARGSSLGLIREEESEHEDDGIFSEEEDNQEPNNCRDDYEYTHDHFLKDFKDIISEEKTGSSLVSPTQSEQKCNNGGAEEEERETGSGNNDPPATEDTVAVAVMEQKRKSVRQDQGTTTHPPRRTRLQW